MENLSSNGVPHLEIERRYLIEMPDNRRLSVFKCTNSMIFQSYVNINGLKFRVRKRDYGDRVEYTKTIKTESNDPDHYMIEREETEETITQTEYDRIMAQKTSDWKHIEKARTTFPYHGHTLEIDIYADSSSIFTIFPNGDFPAILEVEVSSIDEKVDLPDCIHVIKEVTYDPKYRNSNLARRRRDTMDCTGIKYWHIKMEYVGRKEAGYPNSEFYANLEEATKSNWNRFAFDQETAKKYLSELNMAVTKVFTDYISENIAVGDSGLNIQYEKGDNNSEDDSYYVHKYVYSIGDKAIAFITDELKTVKEHGRKLPRNYAVYKDTSLDTQSDTEIASRKEFCERSYAHMDTISWIMRDFGSMLETRGKNHDFTKIMFNERMYDDFVTAIETGKSFEDGEWHKIHKNLEHHHPTEKDVNQDYDLLDIVEMIADISVSYVSRTGTHVIDQELRENKECDSFGSFLKELNVKEEDFAKILMTAFNNTIKMVNDNLIYMEK